MESNEITGAIQTNSNVRSQSHVSGSVNRALGFVLDLAQQTYPTDVCDTEQGRCKYKMGVITYSLGECRELHCSTHVLKECLKTQGSKTCSDDERM